MQPSFLVSTLLAGLAASASACASSRICQPTPPGPALAPTTTTLRTAKDLCLYSYAWPARASDVRGVVIIVHGLRDHAMRYSGLSETLSTHGFAVYAADLRGHGRSGGRRQRLEAMSQLLDDLELVVSQARQDHPGRPLFVFGHSFGGLIATYYASDHPEDLAGVILSAPALQLGPEVTKGQIAGARLVGSLFPNLPAQKLDDAAFVSTAAAKAEFMADPLIDHRKLPARTAKTGVNAILAVCQRFAQITTPLLIFHGSADTITNIAGSQALYQAAPSVDKNLVIYDDQFHDLLHEPVRDRMLVEVSQWLVSHSPTTTPPSTAPARGSANPS